MQSLPYRWWLNKEEIARELQLDYPSLVGHARQLAHRSMTLAMLRRGWAEGPETQDWRRVPFSAHDGSFEADSVAVGYSWTQYGRGERKTAMGRGTVRYTPDIYAEEGTSC